MAKAKYKQILEDVWKENEQLFQQFFILNNEYAERKKRKGLEEEFQSKGEQVKNLLVEGEQDLCRQMEKSDHRAFSSNLADKYWDEVRKYFKYIDLVGVVTKQT